MIKTINLTGTEQAVKFAGKHTHFHVHSLGGEVLVSLAPNIERGKDGVLIVQGGGAGYVHIDMPTDTVYLVGSGEVQVVGSGNAFSPFKSATEGGGNDSIISEGGTVTGTVDYPIIALNLYGKSVQNETPTPGAPVDVVNVGDDGNVKITSRGDGNNLYDISAATRQLVSEDGSIVADPVYLLSDYISCSDYDKITVSGVVGTGTVWYRLAKYDNDKNFIVRIVEKNVQTGSYTFDVSDCAYIRLCYECEPMKDTVVTKVQIEYGATATAYEPYKGTTVTITSGLPLCSVGDVRDELVYNADGTGKGLKRTAKLDSYNGEAVTTDYISSTGGLDAGAEVVYQLATPQEIELSAAEITAMMKLQTFNGVTHIYNDEGAEMKVKIVTNPMLSELINPVFEGYDKRITSLEAAMTAFMEG